MRGMKKVASVSRVTKVARIPNQPKPKKREKKGLSKKMGKKEFDWLVYDKEAGKMFCQYCLDFPNSKNKLSSFFLLAVRIFSLMA